jgi:hypothetical protein
MAPGKFVLLYYCTIVLFSFRVCVKKVLTLYRVQIHYKQCTRKKNSKFPSGDFNKWVNGFKKSFR